MEAYAQVGQLSAGREEEGHRSAFKPDTSTDCFCLDTILFISPSRMVAGQLIRRFLEGINKVVEKNSESREKNMRYLFSQKLNINYLFLCLMHGLQYSIQGNCHFFCFVLILLRSFVLYIPWLAIMTSVVLLSKAAYKHNSNLMHRRSWQCADDLVHGCSGWYIYSYLVILGLVTSWTDIGIC